MFKGTIKGAVSGTIRYLGLKWGLFGYYEVFRACSNILLPGAMATSLERYGRSLRDDVEAAGHHST